MHKLKNQINLKQLIFILLFEYYYVPFYIYINIFYRFFYFKKILYKLSSSAY